MYKSWNYLNICGMLLYLSTTTFTAAACGCLASPKKSHSEAVMKVGELAKSTVFEDTAHGFCFNEPMNFMGKHIMVHLLEVLSP